MTFSWYPLLATPKLAGETLDLEDEAMEGRAARRAIPRRATAGREVEAATWVMAVRNIVVRMCLFDCMCVLAGGNDVDQSKYEQYDDDRVYLRVVAGSRRYSSVTAGRG